MKRILAALITAVVLFFPILSAVGLAAIYTWAEVNVYYNVPTLKTFNVQFASQYSGGYNETASNTTLSNWISFNFTSVPQYEAEPYTNGSASDTQSGITQPIFMVLNTGNANEDIKLNLTSETYFDVCANSTDVSACTAIEGATLQTLHSALTPASQSNITLYANVTSGATIGQTGPDTLFIVAE